MKERPILFSAPMVRAILEGKKTQTRRVVKPIAAYPDAWNISMFKEPQFSCPYGKPGDRLWVRETWNVIECHSSHEYGDCCFFAWDWSVDPRDMLCSECKALKGCNRPVLVYGADGEDGNPSEMYPGLDIRNGKYVKTKPEISWRPSIHMPRWASRINLLVKRVRVERLQNISEDDATAEGVERRAMGDEQYWRSYTKGASDSAVTCSAYYSFMTLWDSINESRPGCSWDANPWVWVVEFERCSHDHV